VDDSDKSEVKEEFKSGGDPFFCFSVHFAIVKPLVEDGAWCELMKVESVEETMKATISFRIRQPSLVMFSLLLFWVDEHDIRGTAIMVKICFCLRCIGIVST
jgi:hypothetical protein